MPAYRPDEIEKKWQAYWKAHQTFRADNHSDKPKYYVLDMFPYPSGAGLHVGHPLGYIASDIVSRYKRHKGYNVLHPMGFDSFGLPAEQYAIQTGQHPALTTEKNIETYVRQLNSLGFSYDWSREIRTSDADYYKWTQWIFLKLFNSWYNLDTDRAESIRELQARFEENGSEGIRAAGDEGERHSFTAGQWKLFSEKQRLEVVHTYRLAYQSDTYVNWCAALGTVLSNDEVKDGLSERGGYPVERRLMPQWNLRITAYADRLLKGLDNLDWPEAVKEMQRNWIGRSVGALVEFNVQQHEGAKVAVFTTRVDTIFGATFLVLAPEHELVEQLTTPEQKAAVDEYIQASKRRSERDRMADVKAVSGVFTGAYALNPVNDEPIQIWLADYVLAGYGTGAVMAVPSGDQRDWLFATHFGLPIVQVTDAQKALDQQADPTKEGRYVNSGFINGLTYKEATEKVIAFLEEKGQGQGKVNFRLRDAIFGRQRYWGEPIPIYYRDSDAFGVAETDLPLVLPEIDEYKPTETGEPPLARAQDWQYRGQFDFEHSTMPGWAGSSWYYLRYMDPHNAERFVGEESEKYWGSIDLYMGGAEHATGHLLYSRFWYLFLKDLGLVSGQEPFQKLINQGMILGVSEKILRYKGGAPVFETTASQEEVVEAWNNLADDKAPTKLFSELSLPGIKARVKFTKPTRDIFFSKDAEHLLSAETQPGDPLLAGFTSALHVDISIVNNNVMNIEQYISTHPDVENPVFVCQGGFWQNGVFHSANNNKSDKFLTSPEVEKMSKSKYNVVNPDVLIGKFGADALRLYEMFLGPLEQFKPWNTNGISGVSTFLKKLWRLFHPEDGDFAVTDEIPTPPELKALHKAIRKAEEDIDKFSFNTSVSTFMILVNELTALSCHKRAILEPLTLLISPYAPHLAEELWELLGHAPGSLSTAPYPPFEAQYLIEDSINYPVALNGKVREQLQFPAAATAAEIEAAVLGTDFLARFGEGKPARKVIVVPGRMVNVVV
ncbi:leucine--tRNA ligase [uncultured Hymenobacter sp.]|uniref:leucine--tRNA ligase n=1 Tax=uncultured Hymenobacter sp. TaxID=170016 RepID=UPI0035CA73E3